MVSAQVNKISVSLDRDQAYSVMKHLKKSLGDKHLFGDGITTENRGAIELHDILSELFSGDFYS